MLVAAGRIQTCLGRKLVCIAEFRSVAVTVIGSQAGASRRRGPDPGIPAVLRSAAVPAAPRCRRYSLPGASPAFADRQVAGATRLMVLVVALRGVRGRLMLRRGVGRILPVARGPGGLAVTEVVHLLGLERTPRVGLIGVLPGGKRRVLGSGRVPGKDPRKWGNRRAAGPRGLWGSGRTSRVGGGGRGIGRPAGAHGLTRRRR